MVASSRTREISGARRFAFSSDSEMTKRRPPTSILAIVLVVACLLAGRPLVAQMSVDSLLDGSSLEDLWVHVNARDWEDLHTRFQENTYYPADLEWRGVRVRNAAIRVRGVAS